MTGTTTKLRKSVRTIYNPKVGCQYIIENVQTGERMVASTLTIRDPEQTPWRSPKSTPPGQEFFKMKSGTKRGGFTYYKFMNSIQNVDCISEDGQWKFIGQRPDGEIVPRVIDVCKNKEKDNKSTKAMTAVAQAKPEPEPEEECSEEELREEILDSEFSNPSALDELLAD